LVQAMQQPIQSTLERMTHFDRFQEAALNLTEAVMVLSSQLERSGHVSRQAVRRRAARDLQAEDTSEQSEEIADQVAQAVVLKLDSHSTRKAG